MAKYIAIADNFGYKNRLWKAGAVIETETAPNEHFALFETVTEKAAADAKAKAAASAAEAAAAEAKAKATKAAADAALALKAETAATKAATAVEKAVRKK